MTAAKPIRIPFYKKWLSYLYEIELERLPSLYDYDLSLCISDGKIQLNADTAIYSWEEKYDNFYKVFEKINWDTFQPQTSLILGFGLGSIAQMLEQKFNQNLEFTGVEIDPNVIHLAQRYILPQLTSHISIIETDAKNFVQQNTQTYDLICVDIFVGATIPPYFYQKEFIEFIGSIQNENGLVIFNHLSQDEEESKAAKKYFTDIFEPQFTSSIIEDVGGNHMLLSRPIFK